MLTHWYQQPIGQRVKARETAWLTKQLPQAFGYYLLQIGHVNITDWLHTTPVSYRFGLDTDWLTQSAIPLVLGNHYELPFACDSVDVIVLVHVLEFCSDPIALLTEVERCLIPEGRLFILSFNSSSLWQLWQCCRALSDFPKARFIRPALIKKTLLKLNCDIESIDSITQRPPLQSQSVYDKLHFLETWGKQLWPQKAGCYGISAIKRVDTLTPIRTKWARFYGVRTKSVIGQQRSQIKCQRKYDCDQS